MDLRLEYPGEYLFVRAMSAAGIQVGERWYPQSVILSTETVIFPWEISRLEDLVDESLEPLLALRPEVVLIGTGDRQRFLPGERLAWFHQRGVGVETMTTAAACRTFNVLASEHRRVVAGLILPPP